MPTAANRPQLRKLSLHLARDPRVPARRPMRRLPLVASVALAAGLAFTASPAPAAATGTATAAANTATAGDTNADTATPDAATAGDTNARILASMNAGRTASGLVGYVSWSALAELAAARVAKMAAVGKLSHDIAGEDIGDSLTSRGISWMGYGEIIAKSPFPFGSDAANNVYEMWKASPGHNAIMISRTYNYVGIGAVQAADGTTWVAAIMTESLDHTAPAASNGSLTRSGRDVAFTWSGSDPRLQTHTAGLRSFDIQMRLDGGSWRTVRDNTTRTRAVFPDRSRGHWYGFRVQAADRRGTLSRWTSEIRIWVP